MGTVHTMGAGCMCAPTAVIRALLRYLVVESNEAVVMDLEAGWNTSARNRQRSRCTHNRRRLQFEIARNRQAHQRYGASCRSAAALLVGNRVMNDTQKEAIESFADKNGLALLALVPFDAKITESDMLGQTPLKNKDFPSVKAIDEICESLLKNR